MTGLSKRHKRDGRNTSCKKPLKKSLTRKMQKKVEAPYHKRKNGRNQKGQMWVTDSKVPKSNA